MRQPRIKAAPGEDGMYHCMSRIVGGEFLLYLREREFLVRLMWRLADFMGIVILDYVVLTNHYHQLLEVPCIVDISDEELYRRVSNYYGEKNPKTTSLKKALEAGGERAEEHRQRHLGRMGDLSEYQKHLKQGFSRWYNQLHDRKGTLWMERFKSVLIEDTPQLLQTMAAYIDLNPVRACLVDDPAKYRHCGYGAALAGDERCRQGLIRVMDVDNWQEAATQYRTLIMIEGARKRPGKRGYISEELLKETLEQGGHLGIPTLLRLRIGHFSNGMAIGSEAFIEKTFQQYRVFFGIKRITGPRTLEAFRKSRLCTLRDANNTLLG